MIRLDHLTLDVLDWVETRDWWRDRLGFEVEFEVDPPNHDKGLVAMRDQSDLTIFFHQAETLTVPDWLVLTVQVDDVNDTYWTLLAAGVAFVHPPQVMFWGYGAELLDPNGYRLRLWDPVSMKAKGGG